ncbi:MICAL-like protein 1 isoform X2 [Thunnus thynnus]|uniref:MICAL-like protein 1 isoform X2 n=1 Tax=Thunnus thynnus TaxID=8237 RepID=UPI0035273F8B
MASPKALREWCRVTCANYPNVEIKNMSTSFRDGLAFCAIIHKHRPDLIDFSSLSKDNVYQNNKLAFDVAETKLGIPALLDPQDMVSIKVPDCLSIITYLFQYYHFFSRKPYAGLASLRSSHITVLDNLTKSKAPVGLKPLKSSTDLSSGEDNLSSTRPHTVCHLCFKPVHLIQRHLIDGKVYHRSCFRCKVCHSTLLAGSYTKGRDAGSLICTHHITDSKSTPVDLCQQIGSTENTPKCKFQAGYLSLDGLTISSVPHYTVKTESQDRLGYRRLEMERREKQERSRAVKDSENRDSPVVMKSKVKSAPPNPPPPRVKDKTAKEAGKAGPAPIPTDSKVQQEATKTEELSELSSPCALVTEENSRPVPAPRRMMDSAVVPVPAPRTKTLQTTSSSPAAGNSSSQSKSPISSHITSPTSGSPKVITNHPWMAIVHPGPWTQLPPAPAPVPSPRSKSVSNPRGLWYRPKLSPPNPFADEVDEDTQEEAEDQSKPLVAASQSESSGNLTNESENTDASFSSSDAENTASKSTSADDVMDKLIPLKTPDLKEAGGGAVTVTAEEGDSGGSLSGPHATSDVAQSRILPRSLSVPAMTSEHSQSPVVPSDLTEANETVTSSQSKVCKENPFDRKPAMSRSKTFQALPSSRPTAPGYGFPLIKRKVQADQYVSTEDLQVEMGQLDKHLEALEQKGVELERNLRDCKNDKEEEQMLMDWFALIHERHILVRRDTELVYLTKQQKLEERQADVEYELRCLLNKPESDWSQEDRSREQQLMDELVAIIEQRNQIISSLDQDRQREREEDELWEDMTKNKEFQKEGLKEMKKSKGRFKPAKVFKMLNHYAASAKDSMDKKS